MGNKIIITDERVEVNGKVYLPKINTERNSLTGLDMDKPVLSVNDFLRYINQVGYIQSSCRKPDSISEYPQLLSLIKSKL